MITSFSGPPAELEEPQRGMITDFGGLPAELEECQGSTIDYYAGPIVPFVMRLMEQELDDFSHW